MFGILEGMVFASHALDSAVLLPLYHLAASSSFATWVAVFCAQWLPYGAGLFAFAFLFVSEEEDRKLFHTVRRIVLPVFLAWGVVLVVKTLLAEPRPFVSDLGIIPLVAVLDPFGSFPSAHATFFGALFGSLYAERARFWRAYGVIAVLVALGRVATGVHWPSDVLVGLLWGGLVGFLGTIFFHRWDGKNAKK